MKAVLFDLDGTLLQRDNDGLQAEYFQRLYRRFASSLSPEQFEKIMWAGITVMLENSDPEKTTLDVFFADFIRRANIPASRVEDIFTSFYEEEFPQLRHHGGPIEGARATVLHARELGYKIVVATLPVYPIEPIMERMEWAGVADIPFDLITSAEVMHYAKPNPGFFHEVAGMLHVNVNECLMVGNEPENDMAAHGVGLKTFFYTGPGCEHNYQTEDVPTAWAEDIRADFAGDFAALQDVLARLQQQAST